MTDYILTNIIISVLALLLIKTLKNAPARLGFFIAITALAAWFMPWHLLPEVSISEQPSSSTLFLAELSLTDPIFNLDNLPSALPTAQTNTPWYHTFTWWHLGLVAAAIGIYLFARKVHHYIQLVKQLNKEATKYNAHNLGNNYQVNTVNLGTPGITTGLFKPVIWLDETLITRSELDSVLLHEATHINQLDIFWIWFICLTENLFWWNPICMLLGAKARQQLELSCDERCFNQLNQRYQHDLASLTLETFTGAPKGSSYCSPVLNMAHTKHFNVLRVKMLNKEKVMKKRHIAMMVAAVSFTTIAAAQIVEKNPTTQSTQQTLNQSESASYNEQLTELLKIAANAKSEDKVELQKTADAIIAWYVERPFLSNAEEGKMRILSLTLVNHLLHKVGNHEAALSSYELWYKDSENAPHFTRNIKADTLLKLGQPELAAQEMETLKSELGEQITEGSLITLARAYIEQKNYEKALATLSHPNVGDNLVSNVYKRHVYLLQNDMANADKVKSKLPAQFASNQPWIFDYALPQSPLLKQI